MESILTSIKKLLGISEEYEHFDVDLIMHINSIFLILNQIGVGPTDCYSIIDANDIWDDFLEGKLNLEMVKTYMYLRVKLLFDPPLSSSVLESTNRMIAEYEWRLRLAVDAAN